MSGDERDRGDDEPRGLSRRAFLGVSAGGAALTTLVGRARPAEAEPASARVHGPRPVDLELRVNGVLRKLSVPPRTTLAAALRDELHLTGTKIGCDRGACGACTVHLAGRPALSCTTLAIEVGVCAFAGFRFLIEPRL